MLNVHDLALIELFFLQLNYREAYHKEKHMYTTVLDTFDFVRCHNFKHFFSNVSEENRCQLSRFDSYLTCKIMLMVGCASYNRKTTLLSGTKSKQRATRFHMIHMPCNMPKARRSF